VDPRAAFDVVRAACCPRPDDVIDLRGLLLGLSALCRPGASFNPGLVREVLVLVLVSVLVMEFSTD